MPGRKCVEVTSWSRLSEWKLSGVEVTTSNTCSTGCSLPDNKYFVCRSKCPKTDFSDLLKLLFIIITVKTIL